MGRPAGAPLLTSPSKWDILMRPLRGGKSNTQRYRSGYNGPDSKSCGPTGCSTLGVLDFTGLLATSTLSQNGISTLFLRISTPHSQAGQNLRGVENTAWRRNEEVITSLTRNQVALTGSWVRIPPSPPSQQWFPLLAFYALWTSLWLSNILLIVFADSSCAVKSRCA